MKNVSDQCELLVVFVFVPECMSCFQSICSWLFTHKNRGRFL